MTLSPQRVALVLGTRPEIIKLSELIRLLGPAAHVVYTGQHYDDQLGPAFFAELGLPAPDAVFAVGGTPRGAQIGEAVKLLDEHFARRRPAAVVVQGDTNATVAGALAANARGIPLVHVEAGLRSFDRAMPEEHNRVVTDHLADLCCAATTGNRSNLLAEGIPAERITVTGNTVIEALRRLLPGPERRRALLDHLGLSGSRFVLATFHRPENVDDPERLETVLRELGALPYPVVLPLHPRTAARVEAFGLGDLLAKLNVLEPAAYGTFLALAAECAVLVSDSGGVQEEATVVGRPVLVVRNSTERSEALGAFARLVGAGPAIGSVVGEWAEDLAGVHGRLAATPSPFGDGTASRRCLEGLTTLVAG